jgi:hypothetical protein
MKSILLRHIAGGAASMIVAWLGATSLQAITIPISGDISFIGGATLNGSLGTATAITGYSSTMAIGGTTSYAGVPLFTPAAFTAFSFAANTLLPNPVTLWQFMVGTTSYSFSATSVSIASQSSTFLDLSGGGTAHIDGATDTAGTWTLTLSLSPNATAQIISLGVSTTVPSAGVPDGGTTVMMLGVALSGLALLKRKLA